MKEGERRREREMLRWREEKGTRKREEKRRGRRRYRNQREKRTPEAEREKALDEREREREGYVDCCSFRIPFSVRLVQGEREKGGASECEREGGRDGGECSAVVQLKKMWEGVKNEKVEGGERERENREEKRGKSEKRR